MSEETEPRQQASVPVSTRLENELHARVAAVAQAIENLVGIDCKVCNVIQLCVKAHLPTLEKKYLRGEAEKGKSAQ